MNIMRILLLPHLRELLDISSSLFKILAILRLLYFKQDLVANLWLKVYAKSKVKQILGMSLKEFYCYAMCASKYIKQMQQLRF